MSARMQIATREEILSAGLNPRDFDVIAPSGETAPARVRTGLRVFDDVEFCRQADPPWDIEGVTQQGALEVGFGPSDAGKSTLYAARACCLATGIDWLGLPVRRRGPVVALVFEGRHAFRKKIRAWKAQHGLAADQIIGVYVVEDAVNFLRRDAMDALTTQVERLGAHELLVDTLAQSIGADEENAQMQLAVTHADLVRRRTGVRVAFIHHSGKDRKRGARGGSALTAAADTVLSLDQERDGHVLRCVRQRDGERFSPLALTLTRTPDGSTVLFERADAGADHHVAVDHAAEDAEQIQRWVTAHPGTSSDAIARGLGKRKADVVTGLRSLRRLGLVTSATQGRGIGWSVP